MLTHTVPHRLADAGRLASARHLRAHAELLRDAEAAERQARRRLRTMRAR